MNIAESCTSSGFSDRPETRVQLMEGFPNDEPGYAAGVSACYAGTIDGHLLMAGGCNFPDKPVVDGGTKRFYKGIYAAELSEDTVLHWKQVGELPQPLAYGVSVSLPGRMILAGGSGAEGGTAAVYSLSFDSLSGKILVDTLPSLPYAIDNMAGAVLGHSLYILGGNSSGKPSASVFALNLNAPQEGWCAEAVLPQGPRVQPVCAVAGDALYLWGGFAPASEENEAVVFTNGYRYFPEKRQWELLEAPSTANADSLTLTGGAAVALGNTYILCAGGVNKDIFRDAISGTYKMVNKSDYLTKPVEWYCFNRKLMAFNIRKDCWEQWNDSSLLARAGSAFVTTAQGTFYVGGETKPGIRTAAVVRID